MNLRACGGSGLAEEGDGAWKIAESKKGGPAGSRLTIALTREGRTSAMSQPN